MDVRETNPLSFDFGKPLPATFTVDDGQRVSGYVLLNRGGYYASKAVLVSDSPFRVTEGSDVTGSCRAKFMSLLDCRGCGNSRGVMSLINSDRNVSECELTFRYATFGDYHLTQDAQIIQGIRFTFDDVHAMLTNQGYDAFGTLLQPNREVLDAIKRQVENDTHSGGNSINFRYDGGAQVKYFTGKKALFPATDTVLGTISGLRNTWLTDSGGEQPDLDSPFIKIDFHEHPVTLEEAFEKMRMVRQFFTWMTGFAPRWSGVSLVTSTDERHRVLVHSPVEWDETQDHKSPTQAQRPMLISPSWKPEKFSEVLAEWLRRNDCPKRGVANTTFFASMPGMYSQTPPVELRQAADAFDMLPAEDKPECRTISDPLQDILKATKDQIDHYQSDPAYHVISTRLGMIAKQHVSLKDTAKHRADIVIDHLGNDKLPRLKELIEAAVNCRNYYTHNSKPSKGGVDFTSLNTAALLAETLQFTYAISELVQCGIDVSVLRDRTLVASTHRFGHYLYRVHHVAVKTILP